MSSAALRWHRKGVLAGGGTGFEVLLVLDELVNERIINGEVEGLL